MSTPSRGRIPAPAPAACSPVSTRLALALCALILPPGGCVLPHLLSWEIGWGEIGLENRAVAIEASILQGGCGGGTVVWMQEVPAASAGFDDPPTLGEGRYGFAARARDASCVWYASGCREIDMPGENQGSLLVVLEALEPPEPACPVDQCIAGGCACSAPGECGSACTSGDCSCLTGGCTMRCAESGDCSCIGGNCTVRCDQNATCSCVGGNCVMDCVAGAECSCEGGNCTFFCTEGAECSCPGGGCR